MACQIRIALLGQATRAHGELEAERMVAQGSVALGLEGQRLVEKPKGMAEKQVLAWWLRQRTTAGRRWVSKRLWMGEESGVSKAIRLVKKSRAGKLNRLKQRLLKGLNDGGEKENKLVREYHYPRPDPVRHERRNAAQVGHAF